MIIAVHAFTDGQANAVAYKKFPEIDKAVAFYRKQLERDCVSVISTRKIRVQEEKPLVIRKWGEGPEGRLDENP